jgi:hypothetical protein
MDEAVKSAAVRALVRERRARLAAHLDGHVTLDADELQKLHVDILRLASFLARVTVDPKQAQLRARRRRPRLGEHQGAGEGGSWR